MDTGLLTMPKPVGLHLRKTEVTPDPEVEKRTRRSFSAEYKLRIIAEAAQSRHGELGALLRRENLYSNQLQEWRRQLAAGGEQALSKSAPGPRPKFTPEQREIEKLRRENARLSRKLEIANGCLDLQKKALAMLDQVQRGNDE
jgi:transposase-like protein